MKRDLFRDAHGIVHNLRRLDADEGLWGLVYVFACGDKQRCLKPRMFRWLFVRGPVTCMRCLDAE
jgi:hypothetical protein